MISGSKLTFVAIRFSDINLVDARVEQEEIVRLTASLQSLLAKVLHGSRANTAHVRQARPYFSLGFLAEVFRKF